MRLARYPKLEMLNEAHDSAVHSPHVHTARAVTLSTAKNAYLDYWLPKYVGISNECVKFFLYNIDYNSQILIIHFMCSEIWK